MIIVDASVAVKWVVSESASGEAAALIDKERLGAPALWLSEASNALWAKVMRRQLAPEEARGQAAELADAPVVSIALPGLLPVAMRLALELEHPIDALLLSFGRHTARHVCGNSGSAVPRKDHGPACRCRQGEAAQRLSTIYACKGALLPAALAQPRLDVRQAIGAPDGARAPARRRPP